MFINMVMIDGPAQGIKAMEAQLIRETSRSLQPTRMFIGGAGFPFVPFAFFPGLPVSQQSRIAAIYQLALQKTREEMQVTPANIPGFSHN